MEKVASPCRAIADRRAAKAGQLRVPRRSHNCDCVAGDGINSIPQGADCPINRNGGLPCDDGRGGVLDGDVRTITAAPITGDGLSGGHGA